VPCTEYQDPISHYGEVGFFVFQLMIQKIISGGQTGADQAALDVAVELGIPYRGWLPKGRKTDEILIFSHGKIRQTKGA
jgi:hypothetical protein